MPSEQRDPTVFVAWSGRTGGRAAKILHAWLPKLLVGATVWLSKTEIRKGERWMLELAKTLQTTEVGIVCLTRESLQSPWLHFEAGAISKSVKKPLVCTLLLGVETGHVHGPLEQFQHTLALDKEDAKSLFIALAHRLEVQFDHSVFEKTWSATRSKLARVLANSRPVRTSDIPPTLMPNISGQRVHFVHSAFDTSYHSVGRIEPDREAFQGKAWHSPHSDPNTGHVLFGPYVPLPRKGDYTAWFRLRFARPHRMPPTKPILRIDVLVKGRTVMTRDLRAGEGSNAYRLFQLPFRYDDLLDMETRVEKLAPCNVRIDYTAVCSAIRGRR